ncbi:MAG: toast rack family protein [Chloroflexota bacterium]
MFEKLGRSLDELIHTVGDDMRMTHIDPKTDPMSIAYPDNSPAQLHLEMGVGKLNLTAGGDKLVEGTVTYNVEEWQPQITVENNQVMIRQGRGWHVLGGWSDVQNSWDLALGTTQPIALSVAKGVGEGRLALGGVPLTEAQIDTGAGATVINFDRPNPENAKRLQVRLGTGTTKIDNLLNANAQVVAVDGGAGEITLNFMGEMLKRDTTVRINIGTGSVKLNIKQGIPVHASVTKGLGDVKARGTLKGIGGNLYETANFASASGPKLNLEITAGLGSVVINAMDGLEDIL